MKYRSVTAGVNFIRPFLGIAVIPLLLPDCKKPDNGPAAVNEPDPPRLLVDRDQTRQTIAGFGGANRMWGSRFPRPGEADVAFGLGDDERGATNGEIFIRDHACSHFARFIRPGFVRIDVDMSRGHSLVVSACEGQDQIVAVVIAPETTTVANLNRRVPEAETAMAYLTDLNKDREAWSVKIKDDAVIVDMPRKRVNTVVIEA